ncbi:MAG: hypothetical protein FWG25_03010, partial [Promicromonosporaceae bacterium]|nr:hypothetical protein [Promicromonosporaceae bacterium]
MSAKVPLVALATGREVRDLTADERGLIPALADRGVTAEIAVWDDPDIDWGKYDLTVIRSCWDFARRRDEFLAWAKSVPRLENNARVVEWNTDRRYLRELAAAEVPVIDTIWLDPAAHLKPRAIHARMPAFGDF